MSEAARFAIVVVSIPLAAMAVYWLLDGPLASDQTDDPGVILLLAVGLVGALAALVLIRGTRRS
jgi:hypothetical protein